MKKALDGTGKIVSTRMEIRTSLFGVREVKASVMRAVRKWAKGWRGMAAVMTIRVALVTKAAPGIQDVVENTAEVGQLCREELS